MSGDRDWIRVCRVEDIPVLGARRVAREPGERGGQVRRDGQGRQDQAVEAAPAARVTALRPRRFAP